VRDQRELLKRIAAEDPELAARLIVMTLPATGRYVSYALEIDGLGEHRVGDGEPEFHLSTNAKTLTKLATGSAGPLGLMLRGRLRIRGKRRKAMKLRRMSNGGLDLAAVVENGGTLDPDLLYRSLPYMIDPEWTKGHDFTVRYVVSGVGTWYLRVRDGEPLEVSQEGEADGTATVSFDDYQRLASGAVSPSVAMQNQLTKIEGQIHPVTLVGRWIARAQGMDDAELEREE
jgi:hypothetical protein